MNNIATNEKLIPLVLSGLAMSAITAIAFHALGWVHLYYSARLIVLPAFSCIALYACNRPAIGKSIFSGWLFGIIAVSCYDLSRIPFLIMGWGDFIPSIGNWFLGTENADPLVGYAWRYIGNGGGLGIAFVMLLRCFKIVKNRILLGSTYGVFVWAGLTLLLFVSPGAQSLMFKLTPLSLAGSFTGHLVFGLVLGILIHFSSKSQK